MEDVDDKFWFRIAMLGGKSFRLLWNVLLTIIVIITFFYGVILNSFGSQWIAILICVGLLGVITFLSLIDIKEEKHRFDDWKTSNGSYRASSKKK